MNTKNFLILATAFIFFILTACTASQSGQVLSGMGQILQQSQQTPTTGTTQPQEPVQTTGTTQSQGTPQTTGTTPAAQGVTLIDLLMQQLGLSQGQAETGAGALFQIAKTKMPASSFSKLQQSVPDVKALLGASSSSSTPSVSSGNSMLALALAFQQQGLSPGIIPQFIPIVLQYVANTGGSGLANSLNSALLQK